jgi:hypothetical protein
MEHESVVGKFRSSEALCVHHQLERFNPLNRRGSDTRIGRRGRPYSETSRAGAAVRGAVVQGIPGPDFGTWRSPSTDNRNRKHSMAATKRRR